MTTFTQVGTLFRSVRLFFSAVALIIVAATTLRGQVGNDNPTGPAGAFNGSVTTGCAYDPFTGTAVRNITDMVVAGAVGNYGLSFSRTSNSRRVGSQFGAGGGWQHPFAWSIDDVQDLPIGQSIPYTVNFPDGRVVEFGPAGAQNGIWRATSAGVPERLKPSDGTYCYLLLRDGGQVRFRVSWTSYYDSGTHQTYYNFSFTAEAIIDPHGLATTFFYDGNGNLSQVTEPAGRSIQFFYTTVSGMTVIDYIKGSDTREVHYTYATQVFSPGVIAYPVLTNVVYYGDTSLTATYTYQAPNVGDANGLPLLASCDDPMYPGPMKRISYAYATANNPDGSAAVYGQILSENSLTSGQPVSTLTINSATTRTETRGDGPSRTFNYSNGQLANYTDFKNQTSYISYDGNGYVSAFQDARNNVTSTSREPRIGALSVLTHPGDNSTASFGYTDANNPYYLYYRTDERFQTTWFTRNGNHQIERIDYPNNAYETFAYNGFGQVYSHRTTSGGIETIYIDGRGMTWASSNPDGTTYYYYDGNDRLEHAIDPRSNTTWFRYNPRGQITRVTHVDGSYVQYSYNVDGTLAWTADENHPGAETDPNQRTRYAYDDYKRVVSVTNPLNQTTTIGYALDWANPLVHTTNSIKYVVSPMNKNIVFDYDANLRRIDQAAALGTADEAWTRFQYDAVGNLINTTDPRGYTTAFGYDNRNRRTTATDPSPFDNQVTHWDYDAANNLRFLTRPDGSRCEWQYDSMNRVIDTYGFANEHTHYDRDLAGNVWQMIDAKNAVYSFGYDAMNRKTGATYPTDATSANRTEAWSYTTGGILDYYKNPADQYQRFHFDTRNRRDHSWWDGSVGPDIVTGYDAANRVTSVVSNSGETTVAFGYDDANRKIWEDQTLSGYPTNRVWTTRDDDGNRHLLYVPNYYAIYYDYTQRNQLNTIYGGNMAPVFHYTYDASGNMTKRQAPWMGINDSVNVIKWDGTNQYDALNRPCMWENTGAGDAPFARSWYQYDSLDRVTATVRDEQSGKGERYGYDATNQLTSVSYNADNVWNGYPQNATRTVTYSLDALNRESVTENGTVTGYSPNALNQYQSFNGTTYNYDDKFNLREAPNWWGVFDASGRLTEAGHGGGVGYLTYDGLGRCVRRTFNPPGGGSNTVIYVYDGWNPIVEFDGAGNLQACNIYGATADEILGRWVSGVGNFSYHSDKNGNIYALMDSSGNVVEKYTYDAFGQPTITDWYGNPHLNAGGEPQSWYGNRFMFQGREYLSELGIYDYRFRYYQPQLGRFLQKDPIGFGGGDANLFRFCGGDPVNRRDPMGLQEPEVPDENEDRDSGSDPVFTLSIDDSFTDRVVLDLNQQAANNAGKGGSSSSAGSIIGGGSITLFDGGDTAGDAGSLSLSGPAIGSNGLFGAFDSNGSSPDHGMGSGGFRVIASTFSGGSDYPLRSAYGPYNANHVGPIVNPNLPGASLPFRFPSNNNRPGVTLFIMNPATGARTMTPIVDVGPWNTSDAYWQTGGVPLAVSQFATGAKGQNGQIVTNPAGIDLTPATFDALGLSRRQGLGEVVFWFQEGGQ